MSDTTPNPAADIPEEGRPVLGGRFTLKPVPTGATVVDFAELIPVETDES